MTIQNRQQLIILLDQILGAAGPDLDLAQFRLVGTSAAMLHGVQLQANDVDILARRRADVDMLAGRLNIIFDCTLRPQLLAGAGQYMASFAIAGNELEVSTVEHQADADHFECFGPGPWTHYTEIAVGGRQLPTVSLELRLLSELARNRPDRFVPIIDYLVKTRYDQALLQRGLAALPIDDDLRARVAQELTL